jgi:hypothetical protein
MASLNGSSVKGSDVISLINTVIDKGSEVYIAKQNQTVAQMNADLLKTAQQAKSDEQAAKGSTANTALVVGGAAAAGLLAILALK